MRDVLSQMSGFLLDCLFPIRCLGCGKNREDLPADERWICPECLDMIGQRSEQVCPWCKEGSVGGETHGPCKAYTSLDGLWSCAYYDDLLERAIHNFKFGFMTGISYPLSELMIRSIVEAGAAGPFQEMMLAGVGKEAEESIYIGAMVEGDRNRAVLIPVPLHKRRYAERGFNQSELLARRIGERFPIPVKSCVLDRIRNTKPQSKTAGREERMRNLKSAFTCVRPDEIRGKDILLVDDICTTSATLDECARELKRCGARRVWGFVTARK